MSKVSPRVQFYSVGDTIPATTTTTSLGCGCLWRHEDAAVTGGNGSACAIGEASLRREYR